MKPAKQELVDKIDKDSRRAQDPKDGGLVLALGKVETLLLLEMLQEAGYYPSRIS